MQVHLLICCIASVVVMATRIYAEVACRASTAGLTCKLTSCRTWTCQRQSSGSYACLPDTSKDVRNGTACSGTNPCLSYACSSGSCTATSTDASRQDGKVCQKEDMCYKYVCMAGSCTASFKCARPPAISCQDIKQCVRATGECSYRIVPDYTACGNETARHGWCENGVCKVGVSCQGNSDCQGDAEGNTMCDQLSKVCVAPGLSVSSTRIMSDQQHVKVEVQARVPVSDPSHTPVPHNLSLCELGSSRRPSCVKVLLQLFDDGDWGHADSFVDDDVFSNIWEVNGTSRAAGDLFVAVLVDGELLNNTAFTAKLTVIDPSVILDTADQVYSDLGAAQHHLDMAMKNGTPAWKALEDTKELLLSKPWVAANSFRPSLRGYRFESTLGLGLAVMYKQPQTLSAADLSKLVAADDAAPGRRLFPQSLAATTPADCPRGTVRGKVLVLDITYAEFINQFPASSRQVVNHFRKAGYDVTYSYKTSVVTALDRLKHWEQYAAVVLYAHGNTDVGYSLLYLGEIPGKLIKQFDRLYMQQQTTSHLIVSTSVKIDAQGAVASISKELWATQKYFSSYTARMDGTIVLINACGSMSSPLLANTFLALGAAAMIGWSNTVNARFAYETSVKVAEGLAAGTRLLDLPGIGDGYYNQTEQIWVNLTMSAPDTNTRLCRCRCGRVCCEDLSRPCVNGKCRCTQGSGEKMCGDKCGCPAGKQCDRSAPHKEGSCVPCKRLVCGGTCCNMTRPGYHYCSGWECIVCETPVCEMSWDRKPGSRLHGWSQHCCGADETCRRDGWLSYKYGGLISIGLRPCCPRDKQCGDLCCDWEPGSWTCADPSALFTYELSTGVRMTAMGLCCRVGQVGCASKRPDANACCDPGYYCAGTFTDNTQCPRGSDQSSVPLPDSDCLQTFPVCCASNERKCGSICYDPTKMYCQDSSFKGWVCPIGTERCPNDHCCTECRGWGC